MHYASPPAAVQELSVARFQDHHSTSEDAVAQWHAVAVAVAEIGLQSALANATHHHVMDRDEHTKGVSSSAASSPASRSSIAAQRDVSKSSLWFILDDDDDEDGDVFHAARDHHTTQHAALHFNALEEKARSPLVPLPSFSRGAHGHDSSETSSETDYFAATKRRKLRQATATSIPIPTAISAMPPPKRTERKRKARRRPPSRICKFDGCEQYVVDQGLCVRHGGGKRCQTEGCTSRAKHQGKCWKHGGSTACKVGGCPNRAKSRGYCWSHGGGTKCKTGSCEKIAISNGLCWAHGGGKRCIIDGCKRQAYERTQNYCNTHFGELTAASAGGSGAHDGDDEHSETHDRDGDLGWRFPSSTSPMHTGGR